MTRKTYVHKLWAVTVAFSKAFPAKDMKIGNALRHNKDFAKNVPKTFGSYEAAWNNPALQDLIRMIRERGGEV